GGSGGGLAYNREELMEVLARGLDLSPVHECLIEESVLGWKEYELEVMRDTKDNVIIICSIENFDPMGVHTGDSITVAPAQTLTDREYQMMRDASLACLREIGVDTGGSNVQFAIDPHTGRMVIVEMNPRVSRSSALASKATGKGIRSLETGKSDGATTYVDELIEPRLITPNPDRLGYIRYAFERGYTEEQVHSLTSIDPWFLRQIREMIDLEKDLAKSSLD